MITGLHHAQITVSPDEVEAARKFYRGVLCLKELPKPESLQGRGGFWLAVGDRSVHVGIEDGVDRSKTKAHVAYAVDDLDWWRKRLMEYYSTACRSLVSIDSNSATRSATESN